jgi:4-hydroxy-4-methyl-2-oxoglutarate aldolase
MSPDLEPVPLLERLRGIDSTSLSDAGKGLRTLDPQIRPIATGRRLLGRAVTADADEDLMSVIAALQVAGPGDVLVVAVGSDEHAVAGELFGTEAMRRGLAGIVIDGRCRDSATLVEIDLAVYARGVAPSAFPARKVPVIQVPVVVGGVEVRPGDIVLGDDDGIVVGAEAELAAVIDAAETIQVREVALRHAIASGESLFDHFNFDEHAANLRAGRPSALSFG